MHVHVHVHALSGCLVLLGFLTALGPARAQSADGPVLQFDIAAQNLGDALDLSSRRTGIAVLMDQRYTRRQSAAVRGAYAAGAALQILLDDCAPSAPHGPCGGRRRRHAPAQSEAEGTFAYRRVTFLPADCCFGPACAHPASLQPGGSAR